MDPEELEQKYLQGSNAILELKALLKQLQSRMERQALILSVLKDMIVAGDKAAEKDFLDRLSAAVANKAAEKDAIACHACGKAMKATHTKCMYCGEARRMDLF